MYYDLCWANFSWEELQLNREGSKGGTQQTLVLPTGFADAYDVSKRVALQKGKLGLLG